VSSPITFSGFNNIDFGSILNTMMTAASQPLTDLQTSQTNVKSQITNFTQLGTYTSTLQTAAAALADASSVANFAATATDSTAVSVTAGAGAVAGHYDVVVNELARAQVTASASSAPDANTTIVATGGSLTVGGQTVTLTQGTTLQGLADAINSNASVPANAAVVQDGTNSFRLVLTAKSTGQANSFTVTNTLTGGTGVSFTDTNGDGVSGDSAADNAVQATDASLTVNNIPITSASNTLNTVIPGVSLTVFKKDPSATIGVDVASDSSALSSSVTTFINAYNDLVGFASTQATAAANGDATSIGQDPVMRELHNELRSALSTAYPTGASSSYLSQAGIEFTQTGTLQLNQSVFNDAVTNGTVDLSTLFTGGSGAPAGSGAFGAINDLLTSYTQGNGTLSSVETQLNTQVSQMTDQINNMQARLNIQRAALQAEFTAADTAMSTMQSQAGSLASVGASLTSSAG
jgi:flagellar hook-associated protein 2